MSIMIPQDKIDFLKQISQIHDVDYNILDSFYNIWYNNKWLKDVCMKGGEYELPDCTIKVPYKMSEEEFLDYIDMRILVLIQDIKLGEYRRSKKSRN